jgi:hypothetical protein
VSNHLDLLDGVADMVALQGLENAFLEEAVGLPRVAFGLETCDPEVKDATAGTGICFVVRFWPKIMRR